MKTFLNRLLFPVLFLSLGYSPSALATILNIGSGSSVSGTYPLNTCYSYNYTQSIYLSSELTLAGATSGTPGYIYSLQFNQTTATSPGSWKDWTIYMGNTSAASFSSASSWISSAAMTTVFSGTVSPTGTGWYTITLSTPFYWDGSSNIVIALHEQTPGYNCTSQWSCTNSGTDPDYRSISFYSDDINPDPASPPVATTRALLFPDIRLDYAVAVPCTGTPFGGTATASDTSICPGHASTINISGAAAATGLSYSWQSSGSSSGPWTTVGAATGTTLTVTPATCSRTYYRRITKCAASGISATSATASVAVSCPVTLPYTENFESITADDKLPGCMSATNPGIMVNSYTSTPGTYNRSNHTTGGSSFASFRFGSDDYLYLPALNLTAGKTYKLSFWYITDGLSGWNTLAAKLGKSQTPAAMTTILGSISSVNNILYKEFSTTFIAGTSGIQYIGIYCKASLSVWYLSLDDISVQELPLCTDKPLAGTAVADVSRICSTGSPTLGLRGTSDVTGLTYSWQSSMSGIPGSWGAIPGGTTATFTAPSISSGTYYRAVVTCTFSGDTALSSELYIPAGPYTPPYSETFESIDGTNHLPACMTATSVAPYVYTYPGPTGAYNQVNHTPGGSKFASFRYGSRDYLFTPGISLIAGRTYEFSFWYITDGGTGWDTLRVAMGNTPTAAGMSISLGTVLTGLNNTVFRQFKARFVATSTGIRYIGIFCKATTNPWFLTLDDILLREFPPCTGMPAAGYPVASPSKVCGSGTTTLDLPDLSPAIGFNFQWQDSVAGGTWGTGPGRPSFGGFSVPFRSGTVSVNTYFRCIVTCAATKDSAVSPELLVPAGPLPIPYIETFESITAANQLPACMTATAMSPALYTYTSAPGGAYNRISHSGSKFASFHYSNDDYLFSPPLKLSKGYDYTFSFWYITDGLPGWKTLQGTIGSTADTGGIIKRLKTISNPANTGYLQYGDTFRVSSTGTYYAAVRCVSSGSSWYLSIDDITLQALPCTGIPDAGSITAGISAGTALCHGTAVILTNTGATPLLPGITYTWQYRTTGSGGVWNTITGATDTIYSVPDAAGREYRFGVHCSVSGQSRYSPSYGFPTLPAHPAAVISTATDSNSFCIGDTLLLYATAFPGASYTWQLNGITLSSGSADSFAATDSGTYRVIVSAAGTPCPGISDDLKLSGRDPGFSVAIDPIADSFLCSGDSITLTSTTSATGLSFQWQRNGINLPGATAPSYTASGTGLYRMKASDGGSCAAVTRTIPVRVSPVPVAVISSPDPALAACEADGIILNATTGPDYRYQWICSGRPLAGYTDSSMLATISGVYAVKIRNAANCAAISEGLTVKIFPSPAPVLVSTGLKLATTIPYAAYQWYRDGILIPGATDDTLIVLRNGFYTVIVKGDNDCYGTSSALEINETSLDVPVIKPDVIRIYPNPVSDQLFIEVPLISFTVSFHDITGRLLLEEHNLTLADLSKYSDGIYLLSIRDDSGNLLLTQHISKSTNRR